MFIAKAKFAAYWAISAVLGLAAGASIIVGVSKSIGNGGFAPNPLTRLSYFVGSHVGIWDWYPNSGAILDSLLSGIGIVSLIAFAIGVAGVVFKSPVRRAKPNLALTAHGATAK
jgi:hypothetical protein